MMQVMLHAMVVDLTMMLTDGREMMITMAMVAMAVKSMAMMQGGRRIA